MYNPATSTALHFSMPLDELDLSNLATSGCRVVQIPWAHALWRPDDRSPTQLSRLTAAGYDVILRMSLADAMALGFARDRLRAALQERLRETNGRGLRAVIVFNEPDVGTDGQPYDLTHGSASWHQAEARLHAYDTAVVRDAMSDLATLVGAPLSNRDLSEDAKGEPGLLEWWTELRPVYHSPGIRGVGVHIYEEHLTDDPGAIDTSRFKHKLYLWSTLWQPPLYLDEFSIVTGGPLDRARAWCSAIRWLQRAQQEISLFSPFCSNGTGSGYDAALIVRDPAAYALLRSCILG